MYYWNYSHEIGTEQNGEEEYLLTKKELSKYAN